MYSSHCICVLLEYNICLQAFTAKNNMYDLIWRSYGIYQQPEKKKLNVADEYPHKHMHVARQENDETTKK